MIQAVKDKIGYLHDNHPAAMGRSYALLAALSNASQTVAMKMVDKRFNIISILPVQVCIAAISIIVFGAVGDSMYNPDMGLTSALMIRGILGAFNYLLFCYGLRVLPVQKFIVLCNTMPVWVVILSPFILNEYPNRTLIAMLVISCLGIVIMVDPSLILPLSWLPESSRVNEAADYNKLLLIIPILGALVGASLSIFLRKFAGRISIGQNSSYFLTFMCFLTGITSNIIPVPEEESVSGVKEILKIGFVGICQVGFLTNLSLAVKYEKRASYVSLLINSQIIIAYALDVIILGNTIKFLNIVGGAMIIFSSVVIALSKDEMSAKEKTEIKDISSSSPDAPPTKVAN